MNVRFCVDSTLNPGATGTHCTGPIDVAESGANHRYVLGAHGTCAGGAIEIEAAWTLTAGNIVEVVHL